MRRSADEIYGQGLANISQADRLRGEGEFLIHQAIEMDPGKQNWFRYLANPLEVSEFGSEQLRKGLFYLAGAPVLITMADKVGDMHQTLVCCESVSNIAGLLGLVFGLIHLKTVFEQD